jgi:phosphate transport system substrate-binding protein
MLALSLAASAKAQMFDPAQLRPYQPKVKIQGAIRVYGSELKGQVVEWEKGFVKFHPDAVFANNFSSSSEGSIAGLYILGAGG